MLMCMHNIYMHIYINSYHTDLPAALNPSNPDSFSQFSCKPKVTKLVFVFSSSLMDKVTFVAFCFIAVWLILNRATNRPLQLPLFFRFTSVLPLVLNPSASGQSRRDIRREPELSGLKLCEITLYWPEC